MGDFPHEMDVDEMEEDVPKRKNRTKARVRQGLYFIIFFFFHFFSLVILYWTNMPGNILFKCQRGRGLRKLEKNVCDTDEADVKVQDPSH